MKVGAILSSVQVTVRDVVDELLQASIAVNVLVIDRPHPVVTVGPSEEVIVATPHASVAVAVPSEPEGFAGLHPKETVV